MGKLKEIEARLKAATPDWKREGDWVLLGRIDNIEWEGRLKLGLDGGIVSEIESWPHRKELRWAFVKPWVQFAGQQVQNDFDLIANAPTDITYLLNRVRKLEGLLTETKPFLARFRPLHEADDRQLSSLLKAIVQALLETTDEVEGDGDEG